MQTVDTGAAVCVVEGDSLQRLGSVGPGQAVPERELSCRC